MHWTFPNLSNFGGLPGKAGGSPATLDQGFGLGFGIDGVKSPLGELGSPGEYNWGGFFYTAFVIDPKEQMITIFMAQLHPTGDLNLDRMIHTLAYQAIVD